jgi:hypothetical protein
MEHVLFRVPSERSYASTYDVFLSIHFCGKPFRVSSCKHILEVELLVREYFLSSPVIESRIKSFEAILIEDDVHNESVIFPKRTSFPDA